MGCGGLTILIVIIVIVAAIATSGSSGGAHKVGTSSSTGSTTTTLLPDFKVGDVIAINGVDVTVNSVKLNYVDPGDSFDTPAPGNEYILVNVTIHNTGSDSINYSAGDFKIQDSQGGQTTSNAMVSTNQDLSDFASLATSGTATGNMAFDVLTANASKLKLVYAPDFWDNQTATIDLN